MGAISFSVDVRLLQLFKRLLSVAVFVETGTFEGESIRRAIAIFDRVYSVELSHEYFAKAQAEFSAVRSVHLYHNRSPAFLREVRAEMQDDATVYWLDAHWCVAEGTEGSESQCPLLEELKAIGRLNSKSVILIDDARLYLNPPPKPHAIEQWPHFGQILRSLTQVSDRHEPMILDDVIVFYPKSVRQGVEDYARKYATEIICLSKRFWGSPLSIGYWQLWFFLAALRLNRPSYGRDRLHAAREAWRQGRVIRALSYALVGGCIAPELILFWLNTRSQKNLFPH